VADVAVELNVGPVICDFFIQGLKIEYSLVLVFQLASSYVDLIRVLCVLPLLCLQFDDLSGTKVSKNAMVTISLLELVKALPESTLSTNSNMLLGCAVAVLVLDIGVPAKDVAIADSINLITGVTILVFFFMELEGVSTLDIVLLHLFSRKGNAEKRSEEAADIVSVIVSADMTHKGWTCQPL